MIEAMIRSASGREHPGQQPNDTDYPLETDIPHANDPALRRYTEYYSYDAAGNIVPVERSVHQTEFNAWWRDY